MAQPHSMPGDDQRPNLSHQQILIVLGGVMAGMFLAALDQSIVGVAMPRIVSELGGLERLSWVVTAYLLTSTASTPLWGKLSDLYGRRLVFQIAIGIFIVGSALCGASQDLTQLIVFRAIQGIGGGGLFAIAFAIIGDVIPARERGKYQGYFGAVFGVSSIAGPLLGGWFTDGPGWRWIFYINVPVGIAALVITSAVLKLPVQRRDHTIDYAGAATIVGAVTSLLLYLNWAGEQFGWWAPESLALLGLALVLGVAFVLVELRAKEPIIPLDLFRNSIFRIGTTFSFLFGWSMFGGFIFLPVYLQTAKRMTATESGLALIPAVAGVLSCSILAGNLVTRSGRYRIFPIVGSAVLVLGLLLMSLLQTDTPYWQIAIAAFIWGAGVGLSMQVITVAVQNAVPFRDLGTATSSITFLRSLGGAIGVAFMGAVLGVRLTHHLGDLSGSTNITTNDVQAILALPDDVRAIVLDAYTNAINDLFLASVPFALLAFVSAWFLQEIPLRSAGQVAVSTAGEDAETQPPPVVAGH